MMRSLYSGVSGLRNHQTRMDVIGNNIANVNTTAYKTSRTVFQDIYSQTVQSASASSKTLGGTNPSQIGLGVRLASIDTIFTSGATQITDNPSDLAIEGDGFFVVDTNGTDVGGISYTRAGNFYIDNAGNLVTSDGYFVMGYRLASGTSTTEKVQSKDTSGNLLWETVTKDVSSWDTVSKSVQATEADGVTLVWETNAAGDSYILADDSEVLISDYDLDPTSYADRVAVMEDVEFYVLDDATEVRVDVYDANPSAYTGVPVAVTEADVAFYKMSDGTEIRVDEFSSYTGSSSRIAVMEDNLVITYTTYTVPDPAKQSDLAYINLADFVNISFDSTGTIWGIDAADNKVAVAQVAMAMFTNNSGLEKAGGSLYNYTANSGEPVYTISGNKGSGKINPGGLEMSNVDLAAEFTDMIITQRGFQANSRIITTSDSMLEELVNLKR